MFKHHYFGVLLAASLLLYSPLTVAATDPPACQTADEYTEQLARAVSEKGQRVIVTFFRTGKAQAIVAVLLSTETPAPPEYLLTVDRVDRIAIAGSTNYLVFSSKGCAIGLAQFGSEDTDKLIFTAMKSMVRNFLAPRNFIT